MKKRLPESENPKEFIEGVHYYFDDGLLVMTEQYLRERGYCCGNGCRHCPYPKEDQSKNSSSSL